MLYKRKVKKLLADNHKDVSFESEILIKNIPNSTIIGDVEKEQLKILIDDERKKNTLSKTPLNKLREMKEFKSKFRSLAKIITKEFVITNNNHKFKIITYISKKYVNSLNHSPIIAFHGGSWFKGSHRDNEDAVKLLASLGNYMIFNVDYSLAPEHPFPEGFEDAIKAYDFIINNYKKLNCTDNIITFGDSAGATFAIALNHFVIKKPILQILWYPCISIDYMNMPFVWSENDYTILNEYKKYVLPKFVLGRTDNKVDTKMMTSLFYLYLKDFKNYKDPRVSPIYSNLKEMPKTLLFSAEFDALRQQTEYFSKLLKENGVDAKCIRYNGVCHGFISCAGIIPQADASIYEANKEIINILKGENK